MNQYDLTIKSFEQKILELSKLITIDKSIKEKIESLNQFKEETRDNIFKQRAKFNEFENRINKEMSGINDILLDSVIYPGVIGGNSKFKTFHEYMDFTLKEINDSRCGEYAPQHSKPPRAVDVLTDILRTVVFFDNCGDSHHDYHHNI
jgi:hypothetical protein